MLPRNDRSMRYYLPLPSIFLLLSMMIVLMLSMMIVLMLGVQIHATNDNSITTTKSPFDSGYDHGCSDVKISDFSDRYINQPGKGPSFHTEEFMRGYDAGYNACS